MKKSNLKQIHLLFTRCLVGFIFIYSGWLKLIAPSAEFTGKLFEYQILPSSIVPFVAHFFPWVELFFGTFLLLGFLTRVSAAVLSACSAVFIVVLVRSILLSLPIAECGCFGEGLALSPLQAAGLDVLLLILTVPIIFAQRVVFSLDAWINRNEAANE